MIGANEQLRCFQMGVGLNDADEVWGRNDSCSTQVGALGIPVSHELSYSARSLTSHNYRDGGPFDREEVNVNACATSSA